MTAFVAKMLTLLGVVLYAGGPIDAVTLIATSDDLPAAHEPPCGSSCVEEGVAAVEPGQAWEMSQVSLSPAAVLETDLNVDNMIQNGVHPLTEVGLRAGIGFEQ